MMGGRSGTAHPDRDGWITSSFSGGSQSCIEVGFADRTVLIRDSKDQRAGRPVIGLPAKGWTTFLDMVTAVSP